MSEPRSLLQNSAKTVLARVERLFSFVFKAMRLPFQQWVMAVSP
jgi:hypothetical protein